MLTDNLYLKNMKKNNKFYIISCNRCKADIKVSPEVYRRKEKVECNVCLQKQFDKFKLS